jgi:hypothetical protein
MRAQPSLMVARLAGGFAGALQLRQSNMMGVDNLPHLERSLRRNGVTWKFVGWAKPEERRDDGVPTNDRCLLLLSGGHRCYALRASQR